MKFTNGKTFLVYFSPVENANLPNLRAGKEIDPTRLETVHVPIEIQTFLSSAYIFGVHLVVFLFAFLIFAYLVSVHLPSSPSSFTDRSPTATFGLRGGFCRNICFREEEDESRVCKRNTKRNRKRNPAHAIYSNRFQLATRGKHIPS